MLTKEISRNRIYIAGYLGYFFTGTLVTITGIILLQISKFYEISPGSTGFIYTVQNSTMFFSIIFAGILMYYFEIKHLLIAVSIIEIVTIIILLFSHSMNYFIFFMGITGVVGGFYMVISTFAILYIISANNEKASKIILCDFFLGLAGVLMPLAAAKLISANLPWYAIYIVMGIMNVAMLIVLMPANVIKKQDYTLNRSKNDTSSCKEVWGKAIYFAFGGQLFFILGLLSITIWLPVYFHIKIKWSLSDSALLVSTLWISIAIGLFVWSHVLKKIKLASLILLCSILGAFFMFISINLSLGNWIFIFIFLAGFFASMLNTGLTAFCSTQVKHTTPALISTSTAFGTAGTMLSALISGLIYNNFGLFYALNTGAICFIICMACCIFAFITDKSKLLS